MGSINPEYLRGWYNIKGTESRRCSCGTWFDHWKNYSGTNIKNPLCSVAGCNSLAEVGAHVRHKDFTKEYIAPLCKGCNNQTNEMTFRSGTYIALANQSETCNK